MSILMPGRDHTALFSFLDYTAESNLIEKETVQSYKSACRTVLATLQGTERDNIFALDLDEVFQRFADAPHIPPLSPTTVRMYRQRTRSAIEGFRRYHADPVNWKPGHRRRRASRRRTDTTPPATAPAQPTTAEAIVHHFPLRQGHYVRISGIPFDITKSEMARMTTYLSHLVAITDQQPAMPGPTPYVHPVLALPLPVADPAVQTPTPVTEPTGTPAETALDQPDQFGNDTG